MRPGTLTILTDTTPASQSESNPTRSLELHSAFIEARLPDRARSSFAWLGLLAVGSLLASAQEPPAKGGGASLADADSDVMRRVISGAKEAERALYLYERIERVESRKEAGDAAPQSVKISRVVPAGTGIAKIPLGPDGKPSDAEAYRNELNKLLNSLTWAAASGQPQREAYQKVQKKQKDRDDLIEATHSAFIFRFLDQEPRDGRM